MSIGRDQFLTALTAIKAAVTGRAARRRQVANLVTAGQEWLAKFDAQDAAAAQAFADSRPAQFLTFVDCAPRRDGERSRPDRPGALNHCRPHLVRPAGHQRRAPHGRDAVVRPLPHDDGRLSDATGYHRTRRRPVRLHPFGLR